MKNLDNLWWVIAHYIAYYPMLLKFIRDQHVLASQERGQKTASSVETTLSWAILLVRRHLFLSLSEDLEHRICSITPSCVSKIPDYIPQKARANILHPLQKCHVPLKSIELLFLLYNVTMPPYLWQVSNPKEQSHRQFRRQYTLRALSFAVQFRPHRPDGDFPAERVGQQC